MSNAGIYMILSVEYRFMDKYIFFGLIQILEKNFVFRAEYFVYILWG